MAFLEKLGTMAKNMGDKAGDAVETNKLNNKIKAEKAAIDGVLRQIGEHCYQRHTQGQEFDAEITELVTKIDAHYAQIKETEEQIQKIKTEGEAQTQEESRSEDGADGGNGETKEV